MRCRSQICRFFPPRFYFFYICHQSPDLGYFPSSSLGGLTPFYFSDVAADPNFLLCL